MSPDSLDDDLTSERFDKDWKLANPAPVPSPSNSHCLSRSQEPAPIGHHPLPCLSSSAPNLIPQPRPRPQPQPPILDYQKQLDMHAYMMLRPSRRAAEDLVAALLYDSPPISPTNPRLGPCSPFSSLQLRPSTSSARF